jgi:ElaB/YqjD/DUF883 family membrane-anchored ribosome-binding protein
MNTPAEKLVGDVKILAADIEELLKATAAQTGERIAEARVRVQAAIGRARAAALEHGRHAARATHEYVHHNPWGAVGIAAGIGLLIGLLIARR